MSLSMNKLSRRNFIKGSAAGLLGCNIIGCGRRKEQPNLLFLWTDQQRADTMKVYGNNRIKTPNLNKLAGESVVFQNGYVSQPVCTPSRSTVMTGLWPHQNGCTENNVPISKDTFCLPEILNHNEYRSGYFGKWHLGDEVFKQHAFDEWATIEDIYYQYFSEGRDRGVRSSYHHWLIEKGYKPNDPVQNSFEREYAAGLPLEHCKPRFLEEKTVEFLKANRNNPFMLYVNFLEPHPPPTGPLNDLHGLMDVDLPPNLHDELAENEPEFYRKKREQVRKEGFKWFRFTDENVWRRYVANYWGLVSQVDTSVGAILNSLEDLGLADNTIVVYTSDHGEMLGSHGLVAKGVMFEEACRVPWLMRIPQFGRQQAIQKGYYSHIDLMPTLLDLLGKKPAADMPGRSLVPEISGTRDYDRDVFMEWNPSVKIDKKDGVIIKMDLNEDHTKYGRHFRTVISQDGWKLSWSDDDRSQLFDLKRDPFETTNLFDSGQHEKRIALLKQKIRQWQQATGDRVKLS